MPIYEYECSNCRSRFDRLENLNESSLITCPDCGGIVHRIVSKTAGFRVNDSAMSKGDSTNGHCGNQTPCCGRETRCSDRSCK